MAFVHPSRLAEWIIGPGRETAAKLAIAMAGTVEPGPLRPPFLDIPAEVIEAQIQLSSCEDQRRIGPFPPCGGTGSRRFAGRMTFVGTSRLDRDNADNLRHWQCCGVPGLSSALPRLAVFSFSATSVWIAASVSVSSLTSGSSTMYLQGAGQRDRNPPRLLAVPSLGRRQHAAGGGADAQR